MRLSKSRYCNGIQCPKMLWMKQNMPDAFDDTVMDVARLETGSAVGELAKGYFGDYANIEFGEDKLAMAEETKRLIENGATVITEATFAHGDNFCMVDILRKVPGGFDVIEVKSSTSVKNIYYDDMAYQCYVVKSCGYDVKRVFLMHLNNKYERHGDLDLKKLFTLEDCSDTVFAMLPDVAGNIAKMSEIADAENEPSFDIDKRCFEPYECGFRGHCWKHIPEHSVFDVAGLWKSKKFDCYQNGILTFEQLLKSKIYLNPKQERQIKAEVLNQSPHTDAQKIQAFLKTLNWPLYFLDFETYMPAIPPYDDTHPYEQIPFQYSLHIQNAENGDVLHREFLAESNSDPRKALAENLCKDIPKDVCVIAYNMSFERTRLAELANAFPNLAEHLLAIRDNIKDLMQPFADHAYYQKEFGGSYSIKAVLPVLCGDDPTLNYEAPDGVHNGSEAMAVFPKLSALPPEDAQRLRESLLAYCKLDTLAMVKILEKLQSMAASNVISKE